MREFYGPTETEHCNVFIFQPVVAIRICRSSKFLGILDPDLYRNYLYGSGSLIQQGNKHFGNFLITFYLSYKTGVNKPPVPVSNKKKKLKKRTGYGSVIQWYGFSFSHFRGSRSKRNTGTTKYSFP